jgi:hypothetical protein
VVADSSPLETRAHDHLFVTHCRLEGLRDRLPLRWPAPLNLPPSPKRRYRSHYVYCGGQDLDDAAVWAELEPFDLTLRLIDFSPLRLVLARRLGWTSARGWTPFDPVSLFLLHGWQITNGWNRSELLKNLRKARYADYVQRFGFEDDDYPTEGGLRYWLTELGRHSETGETVAIPWSEEQVEERAIQFLNELIAQSIGLLVEAQLFSPEALTQALLCPDGMLHQAASSMHCAYVRARCYQPTSPEHPRPCYAQEKGQTGCACDTLACTLVCRRATPRDPEARYVHYTGNNRAAEPATEPPGDGAHGDECYGYQSLPLQVADRPRRFSAVLLDDFLTASARAELPAAALLRQLERFYPDLHVDAVAGDSGLGYDVFLRTVYALPARRVIDQRRHPTDQDKTRWPLRQYDDRGRPLCPYGYALTSNGFDSRRRRHKWFCGQACRRGKEPAVRLAATLYPPPECPHLDSPRGLVLNIGERFADGSIRLVRDVPVGSPEWEQLYHRGRNAVEGRNSTRQRWDLKRLPVYGTDRGKAYLFLADVWDNLTTLARLVQEATAATGH